MAGNVCGPMAFCGLFAFVPVMVLCLREKYSRSDILLAGLYMGLGFTLPQMYVLRMPIIITAILLVYLVVLVMLMAWGVSVLIKGDAVWGSLAVGAYLAVMDWAGFTVLPMWGTAQSFGRSWSAYPSVIGFVSTTGIVGIIFVLGFAQALGVNYAFRIRDRRRITFAMGILIGIVGAMDLATLFEKPAGSMKVAAVGWLVGDGAGETEFEGGLELEDFYERSIKQAAVQGAKVIVSPELGFYLDRFDREAWIKRFGALAKEHGVFLIAGYFNVEDNKNRCMFVTDEGEVAAEYTKTYLTPFEDFIAGRGEMQTVEVEGVKIGAMVCQDDNFTDLSREYGREEVPIVAVPTLDWKTVNVAHFQGSLHRTIECRYAIVRAAINGTSAIVSAKGKVLAKSNLFEDGPGVITAEVGIYRKKTFFSEAGYWLVAVCFVYIACYWIARLRQNKKVM
jgi:apolipoprotein N-acyltransferase